MSTNLSNVETREVVSCGHCTLVQFLTANGLCRRCHQPFESEDNPQIPPDITPPPPVIKERKKVPPGCLGEVIANRRTQLGIPISLLSKRINLSLSHLLNIENYRFEHPGLLILERIAWGIDTRGSSLLRRVENPASTFEEPFHCLPNDSILRHVGPAFKKLREKAGLTQEDIATAVSDGKQILVKRIDNRESGLVVPYFSSIKKFAVAIGQPTSEVVAAIERETFPGE
jgi:transcriptional regulator with XRE-family HTH domain